MSFLFYFIFMEISSKLLLVLIWIHNLNYFFAHHNNLPLKICCESIVKILWT